MSNDVEFYVDFPNLSGGAIPLKNYEITFDLFSGATWDVEIDPKDRSADGFVRAPIRILLNKAWMVKGYIDRIEMTASKDDYTQKISGRDMSSILIDNYLLKYKPYPSGNVPSIVQDVWNSSSKLSSLVGLGLYISGVKNTKTALNPPLTLTPLQFKYTTSAQKALPIVQQAMGVRTIQGQTIHDFISNLINQFGCYYYNQPGTDNIIVATWNTDGQSFFLDGTLDATPNFLDFATVENREFSRDYQDYYPMIRMTGQSDGDIQSEGSTGATDIAGNKIPAAISYQTEILTLKEMQAGGFIDSHSPSEVIRNNFVKFYVQDLTVATSFIWNYNSYRLLLNKRMEQTRSLGNLRCTVYQHTDSYGRIYYPNRTYHIKDDMLRINGKFLLVRVTHKGSRDSGPITDLEFMPVLNANPLDLRQGVIS